MPSEPAAAEEGFREPRSCRSGVETGRFDLIDAAVLEMEERGYIDVQHTIVLEAVKPGALTTVELLAKEVR